jgi:hypothetical protein
MYFFSFYKYVNNLINSKLNWLASPKLKNW